MKNLLRQFIKYFVQWYLLLGMLTWTSYMDVSRRARFGGVKV
ncbi:hypothetical protein C8D04_2762 [Simplicispira sp. 125]|nr:hypothetical protein C8D04_2762 [Simplicispira sp. 125]REG18416.1 hypothetical protein C8D01_3072 [Simplicispira sp. 110]